MDKCKFQKKGSKKADMVRSDPSLYNHNQDDTKQILKENLDALNDIARRIHVGFINRDPDLESLINQMSVHSDNVMSALDDAGLYEYVNDFVQRDRENIERLREEGKV